LRTTTSKALRHGHYAGAGFVIANRFDHQFLDRLLGESCQIAQKLSVTHEKGSSRRQATSQSPIIPLAYIYCASPRPYRDS
jgi:hypothetical protein